MALEFRNALLASHVKSLDIGDLAHYPGQKSYGRLELIT